MLTAIEIYERLLSEYGQPQWWSDDPYIVMVQAVLVQNTAWSSVTKVTGSISELLTPTSILSMTMDELETLIRPCGFCKAKAVTIRKLTEWYALYEYNKSKIQRVGQARLREELLAIKGVGNETADVILVYALHKPSFVIDAYTRRFLSRLRGRAASDDAIRAFFVHGLPMDERLYGWYHWLILTHSIDRCRKTAICSGCPFADVCHTYNHDHHQQAHIEQIRRNKQ